MYYFKYFNGASTWKQVSWVTPAQGLLQTAVISSGLELEDLLHSLTMWLLAGLSLSLVVGHLTMWPLHSLPECPSHMAAGFPQSDNQERKRREKRTQYRSHLFLQPNIGNDISILLYSIGHKDQLWGRCYTECEPKGVG